MQWEGSSNKPILYFLSRLLTNQIMSSKKHKRNSGSKRFAVTETLSLSLKIELDKFLADENATEHSFPTFLSAQERGFIHEKVANLGLKSKSKGKGVHRFITVYKRSGSTIIQSDAKLILDSNMRCSINELLSAYPLTSKEKDDISIFPEKDKSPQIVQKPLSQFGNGVALVPNTTYNPELLKFREKLPVYEKRYELVNAIAHNQVVMVAGVTGSGKTTQLPQLVLDYCQEKKIPVRMFCTQPRRISAVSVAERVAYERSEKIGQSIGYQIRLESRSSPRTILTYCTNGVMLRTMMSGENSLAGVSHVFVDEVHERDRFSDFLLIALRDNLQKFKDLKVILMSATMDTQIFSRYFNNCPVISIPGTLHDVQTHYLEDILKMTQYKTRKMVIAEMDLRTKQKKGKGYNWLRPENKKSEEASGKEEESPVDDLDEATQEDVNGFLDECFKDGTTDPFGQILYMYVSEGLPVDCKQTSTGRTGLIVAAYHGLTEIVQQILKLGANPHIKDKDGKTAYNYAKERGHEECAKLISTFNPAEEIKEKAIIDDDNPEDNFLVDVYHHTISEEVIDHDLMLVLIKHIHLTLPKGSILIFLPGYDDITTLRDKIQACADMNNNKYQIFTLHSNMQTIDQKKVFNPLPNARKIIISTNIAETSITIDDVVYVVDSCKVKEKYYESSDGVCSLQCVWTSQAGCFQRAGRAGRTKPGHCYHMCSRRRFNALALNSVPEILRVPLQELCLHTKLLAPPNTRIADFLARALEPPSSLAVKNAVNLLKTIGALTQMEDLTEIGQHLLDLTVDPKLAKMLLYACIMKCLDPILTIVCSLANKEPFQLSLNPESRRKGNLARKEFTAESYSDHMTLLRAFQAWQTARSNGTEKSFCAKNLICGATMEMIVGFRSQLLAQLRALGLVKARGPGDIKDVNINSEKWHVIKAVLVSGLYPSIARVDRDSRTLRTSKEVKVAILPSSALHKGGGSNNTMKSFKHLPTDWIVFEEISRMGRYCFLRCNTLVTPLTVALFGGPLRLPPDAFTQRANMPGLSSDSDSEADENNSSPDTAVLTLDNWMAFTADASDAISVYNLRQKLCALILRRMTNPSKPAMAMDDQIINTVVHVLCAEEKNIGLVQPTGIGQRPKPMTIDSPNWRMRLENDEQHRPEYKPQYQPVPYATTDYSGNTYYHNSYYQNRNGGRPQNASLHQFYPQVQSAPKSPMSPNGKTLLANIEKYAEKPDATRYFICRVEEQQTVEASQNNGTFNFPSNTLKKILKAKQDNHKVVVFFICLPAQKLLGSASLLEAANGIASLEWIHTHHLPLYLAKHIVNGLGERGRVCSSRDGTEICSASARAITTVLDQGGRRTRHHPRPIQKHHNQ